ncbi:hypothetical protein BU23DRAFT_77553 [Bimuria novae-zelandiae CBS 107.79]|uniref:Uncharacterized protein n=1 Tax=Bimuria novae-zelandiae CBS 107.79 TaxID=1447943 RepID=A0A6A5UHJ1_9PLEO|nr:hypothetical protein BU23DRAFT_77553 [Bimuria novae-zelandiae CBS 107.79]
MDALHTVHSHQQHAHQPLRRCPSISQHTIGASVSPITTEATIIQPSTIDEIPPSTTQPTSQPPDSVSIVSRRSSPSRKPQPLHQITESLPNIPPPPSDPPRTCPRCATPRAPPPFLQKTSVCQTCLTAFKFSTSTRHGSVLTEFPPLLAAGSTASESDGEEAQDASKHARKVSIVQSIGRVFGMFRGGGGSRRGSESSLESWDGRRSSAWETPERVGSVVSTGSGSSRPSLDQESSDLTR